MSIAFVPADKKINKLRLPQHSFYNLSYTFGEVITNDP